MYGFYMQNGKLFLDIIQEHDRSTAVILHLSKMFTQGENCDKKNVQAIQNRRLLKGKK